MSLDNAADSNTEPTDDLIEETAVEVAEFAAAPDDGASFDGPEDEFDLMSDRELLLYIARTMSAVLTIAGEVQAGVGPVMEKAKNLPLLGGLFK